MKTCNRCGRQATQGNYCISCGSPLIDQPQYQSSLRISGKASGTVIVVSAIVLCVLIGVIAGSIKNHRQRQAVYTNPGYYVPAPNVVAPDPYGFTDPYAMPDIGDFYIPDSGAYTETRTICISCKGSGYCDFCYGTGTSSMYGQEQSICSACYGTGICTICDGTGYY